MGNVQRPAKGSSGDRDCAIHDMSKTGPAFQTGKRVPVGSCHPGLQPEIEDFLEQRGAAQVVEMGRNLVQQQDWRTTFAAF